MKLLLPALVLLMHSWYPQECCDGRDCHPVPCTEIARVDGGYLWRHDAGRVFFASAHVSPDESCHVCVLPNALEAGVCLFLAAQT